jgi:hypothetical protein
MYNMAGFPDRTPPGARVTLQHCPILLVYKSQRIDFLTYAEEVTGGADRSL